MDNLFWRDALVIRSLNVGWRNSHWFRKILAFTNTLGRNLIRWHHPKGKSSLLLPLKWKHGGGVSPQKMVPCGLTGFVGSCPLLVIYHSGISGKAALFYYMNP